MDPDAALAQIRALLRLTSITRSDAERLVELTEGLDTWLSQGGFLPAAWQPDTTTQDRIIAEAEDQQAIDLANRGKETP